MLTVICEQPGVLKAIDTRRPTPKLGEVLLRVRRVGVCGTDMHIFSGNQPFLTYPRVMGHEIAGTIESVPDGSHLSVGDTVYVMPYLHCGKCGACRQGKTNCCVNLQVLGVHTDGAFTEWIAVAQEFVHKADGVSMDEAAMVEFLAIGAHAVRRSEVTQGKKVLVVGAGPIGLATMLFCKLRGADVTALDTRLDRLKFAQSAIGVDQIVLVSESDRDDLAAITKDEFFDVVFDATGNPKAMERGFGFVAHGGKYVFISIVTSMISFSDPEFHKRELSLIGSRNATSEDFETVLTAMREGNIPTEKLKTHSLSLQDVVEKFQGLLDPTAGVIKAMVEC